MLQHFCTANSKNWGKIIYEILIAIKFSHLYKFTSLSLRFFTLTFEEELCKNSIATTKNIFPPSYGCLKKKHGLLSDICCVVAFGFYFFLAACWCILRLFGRLLDFYEPFSFHAQLKLKGLCYSSAGSLPWNGTHGNVANIYAFSHVTTCKYTV